VVDQTITVTVQVQAGSQQVDGAAAYLNFDPTLLQVVSLTPGTTLPVPLANSFDNTAGTINYAAGNFSNFPSGTFTLVQIALKGVAETPSTTISYNNTNPRQSDATRGGQSVLGSEFPATVKVTQFSTAITLSSFTARGVADNTTCRVTLAWTMATDFETAGFNLYRSEQVAGPYTRLNAALIRGTGDWLLGGRHEYEDTSVEPGKTYYYEVEEVTLSGTSERYDPIVVTMAKQITQTESTQLGALLGAAGLLLFCAGAYGIQRQVRR
jgi:hypothetical protein